MLRLIKTMQRVIVLVVILIAVSSSSLRAQLLTPGQSFTYSFLEADLINFGDASSPNPRGYATFYSDPARSTPGAVFTVDLFESNTGESPIASNTGSSTVTANANNAWQDLQGVARVTVVSGDIYFDPLVVGIYRPGGIDYEFYSATVPVPEPGAVTLGALGLLGLLGWNFARRR